MQDRFYFRYAYNNKIYDVFAVDFFNSTAQLVSLDRAETLFTKIETDKLIQCTGLKDKNGKLIFEGDIVECWKFSTGQVFRAIIKWYEDSAGFKIYHLDSMGATPQSFKRSFINVTTIEIIGNIYENPELLEVKQC